MAHLQFVQLMDITWSGVKNIHMLLDDTIVSSSTKGGTVEGIPIVWGCAQRSTNQASKCTRRGDEQCELSPETLATVFVATLTRYQFRFLSLHTKDDPVTMCDLWYPKPGSANERGPACQWRGPQHHSRDTFHWFNRNFDVEGLTWS